MTDAPNGVPRELLDAALIRRPGIANVGRALGEVITAFGAAGSVIAMSGVGSPWTAVSLAPAATGIATTAVGVALLNALGRRHIAAQAFGGAAMLLGFMALLALTFGTPAAGQPMTIAASIAVTVGGVASVVLGVRSSQPFERVVLGVAGITIVALAVTVAAVGATGLLGPVAPRRLLAEGAPLAAVGLGFGGYLLALIVASGLTGGDQPRWLAPASGVAITAVVVVVWLALVNRERAQVLAQTGQAVNAQRIEMLREIERGTSAIERIAAWASSGLSADLLPDRIATTVEDVPGLIGGVWFPADGVPMLVPGDVDTTGLEAALVNWRIDTLAPDPVGLAALDSVGARIAVIATGCNAGGCGGAFVGVVDVAALLATVVGDSSSGFHFALAGGRGFLPGLAPQAAQARWVRRTSLRAGGLSWTVAAWPTAATLDRLQSGLPATVLFMGLLVGGLLPAALHFGQVARRNAEARALSDRRFRTAFDSAFHFQLLLDLDGTVLEVNRAALQHVGAGEGSVRGRPITAVLWWAARPEAAAELARVLATVPEAGTARLDQALPDGPVLSLAFSMVPDSEGVLRQILMEGRDDTARRRAESALQEVSTLTTMGRLAARVAHEINNPLAGIQSAFLLVRDAIPDDHPHRGYVGAIEREIGRIGAVTRQLYETYRPDTESTPQASVATLISDAATLLGQLNKRSGVRIEVDVRGVPAVVPVPSAMIRQIIFNLVQNAVDASPPDGVVSVHATARDGRLTIRVRDQGTGVPPGLRERIFDPFFSTKQRDNPSSGMGLGLSLVQRGVTAVGGTIAVADAEGGGAEFTVDLPLSPPSGEPT